MTDYYVYDGGSNTSPYENWTKAATTLEQLDGVATGAGDVIHIASDHAETGAAAYTFNNYQTFISENRTSGNYQAMEDNSGAITCNSGSVVLSLGYSYVKGLNLINTISNSIFMRQGGGNDRGLMVYEDCRFENTQNDRAIAMDTGREKTFFINCKYVRPNNAADDAALFVLHSESAAYFYGGSIYAPYAKDINTELKGSVLEFHGVDLSQCGSSASELNLTRSVAFDRYSFHGCLFPSTIGYDADPGSFPEYVAFINSDDTADDLWRTLKMDGTAILEATAGTFKTTGGFSPLGTTDKVSWEITDATHLQTAGNPLPFLTQTFDEQWNTGTGAQTAEVEILLTNNGAITDLDSSNIGLMVKRPGNAGDLLADYVYEMADVLTTATTYSEAGTAGSGWTYGGALSTKKALTLSTDFTAGRAGLISFRVWVKDLPAGHELFINPVVTLS